MDAKRDACSLKEYRWWAFSPVFNKQTGPAYAGGLTAAIKMLELKI